MPGRVYLLVYRVERRKRIFLFSGGNKEITAVRSFLFQIICDMIYVGVSYNFFLIFHPIVFRLNRQLPKFEEAYCKPSAIEKKKTCFGKGLTKVLQLISI